MVHCSKRLIGTPGLSASRELSVILDLMTVAVVRTQISLGVGHLFWVSAVAGAFPRRN